MKFLYLIPFLFLSGSTYDKVENPCSLMFPRGENEDWGEGAYYMPEGFYLPLYNYQTTSEIFGYLSKQPSEVHMRLVNQEGNIMREYFGCQFKEGIGAHQLELLMAKKCSNPEYVCVLWKCKEGGVFAKKADLKKLGAVFYTYWDYLFKQDLPERIIAHKKWANIGVNINKSCLNLRTENNTMSETTKCIPGNDELVSSRKANHLRILEHRGNWAKVEVISLKWTNPEDDCPSTEFSNGIGWVKAIDGNGFPNIWYSVTGY